VFPTGHLFAFFVTAFVIVAVPGPSALFTISRALTIGRRGALLTVLGNALGVYLQAVAVTVGVGALLQRSAVAYSAVKLFGAGYLIYLGVQSVRHRRALSEVVLAQLVPARASRVIVDGFLVGLGNPKTIVFFAAVLPQFVDRDAGQLTVQLLILGAVVPVIALVVDGIWATAAGIARDWFARSPRRVATIGGAGGLAMICIGVSLAVSGRNN
jgi:threonine/homoserine/homoserine lactone efflux protein